MKLAIATGVLAQALPTFSKKNVNLIPHGHDHHESLAKTVTWNDKDSDMSLVKPRNERRHSRGEVMQENLQLSRTGVLTNQRRRVKNQDTKYCIPSSNDPDIGILSCGQGMFCKPSEDSFLGGQCEVNEGNNMGWSKAGMQPTVECDPAATADIGILSCGNGERCVPSSSSGMGGFCMSSSESRHLQATGAFGMCTPSSSYYKSLNCDCSGYDTSSGSGEIPCLTIDNYCLGLSFPGCRYTCETRIVRYQVSNFTLQAAGACSNFTSSGTTTGTFCSGQTYDSGTCAVSINGQACTSCTVVPDGSYSYLSFDCTNVGGVVGNTKQSRAITVPSIQACYVQPPNPNCTLCTTEGTVMVASAFSKIVSVGNLGNFSCKALHANEYLYGPISENYCAAAAAAATSACCDSKCNLCGEGNYIPSSSFATVVDFTLMGQQSVTCNDMAYAAYASYAIAGGNCQEASAVAQAACCAPLAPTCNICDGAPLANPYTVVTTGDFTLPCFVLDGLRNETVCDAVKQQAIPLCCSGDNNPSPSQSPNSDAGSLPTPAGTPPEPSSPEAQVPSGASMQFPMGGILSTLGLLAVGLAAFIN